MIVDQALDPLALQARHQAVFQLLRIDTPIEGDEFVHWDNNQDNNYSIVLS